MASGGHPPEATTVSIGPDEGYLFRARDLLSLYAVLPPSRANGLDLLFISKGLTAAQLEQIASSGLTASQG
jgi:hypothetical protein